MSRPLVALPLSLVLSGCVLACGGHPTPPAAQPVTADRGVPYDLVEPRTVAVVDPRVAALTTVGGHADSPVLLVVGDAGLSPQPYAGLRALASPDLRVATWELVAEPGGAQLTVGGALDAITSVREALGVEQVHLAGHRFGALLALAYTMEHGDEVTSLVLMSPWAATAAGRIEQRAAHRRRRQRLQAAGLIGDIAGLDCTATWRAELSVRLFDAATPVEDASLPTCRDGVRRALLESLALAPQQLPEATRLAAVTTPTLLVYGAGIDGDGVASGELADWLGTAVVDEVGMQHCGSLPWLECADAFYPVLDRFLTAAAVR